MKPPPPEMTNHLAAMRQKRGLSAARLAAAAGVSRQTIYSVEAGRFAPNTAVALRLARALGRRVEEIFSLASEPDEPELPSERVTLLPGCEAPQPGQPVQLCRVDRRLMATTPSPFPWYLPPGDAIATGKGRAGKMTVQIFNSEGDWGRRLLVAGCDPGISVLARHALAAGIELVLVHRNSTQALDLLRQGAIHVAGTHLRDEASGESNLSAVDRVFPHHSAAVISFSGLEEGIVTARGNPKDIRGIADFHRRDVRIVNRERGSGSRLLLDTHLKRLKIGAQSVAGYRRLAPGHLPAAWQVRTGEADCCISTRAAARAFGLGFIPLASERFDFAIRRQHLALPAVQTLLETLNRASFRRELESLGGYDTRTAGQRML